MGTHPVFESDFDCLTENMAWRCSGKSNTALIENLYKADIITSKVVRCAMSLTDRRCYVGKRNYNLAYEDRPLSIGYNATISAPHMHAYALENLLDPLKNAVEAGRVPKVLDVGCGSGYLLGAFARCYGAHVTGLEHIKDLYDLSVSNFSSDVKNSDEDGESISERVEIHHCDGRLGWPSESTEEQYDVIHVGAAAPGSGGRYSFLLLRIEAHLFILGKRYPKLSSRN